MNQLGNLAIVAARNRDCLLQIYDDTVTVFTGEGTTRKNVACHVWDNAAIDKIIAFLNFGTEPDLEVEA